MTDSPSLLPCWAVAEFMGHVRHVGYLSETTVAGTPMIRVDLPGPDGTFVATRVYGAGSVYCLTPVTEDFARAAVRPPAELIQGDVDSWDDDEDAEAL